MEHLNPVTGSPLRVGPHGGDMQPRAYGSSVDAEYFDARQLETEVLSHNAQVIRDRERPTAESEEEVLEWWERAAAQRPPALPLGGDDGPAPAAPHRAAPRSGRREKQDSFEVRVATPQGSHAGGVSVVGPEGRSEEQRAALRREHELLVLRDREARAARLEKERDDERREDEKRLRQASSFLPSARDGGAGPARTTGRGRRPSANGRGSKLGDIISYDGGRAGRSTREDAPANLRRDDGVTRDQLRRRDDVYGAPGAPFVGLQARPAPRSDARAAPSPRGDEPAHRPRAAPSPRAAATPPRGDEPAYAEPSPSAYDPPRAKNDSIARHLQDALAAALRENERLDGDLKAALAEVERYRRRFGPLPP
ncbi:hypothetical protein AURANDRAFT_65176 [Aureococcus anophagefferens]|uniref:Uncharacterized protein n=1 Tax=Aureococcus anophagefferens TaxID=44056 RepID=F0YCZ1_AURAN|nr:hypothetical protein AURANDRAFT_65176 [Aureococcus anophagefferens]EGB07092.1 hypothetical protein AURANDRAFT_65176 [Aureococcus anophagefferens]|eukprot:XP_009038324.1 hypothetical protein AURANDRAFT_65176 [Aureococcus anophagefferens]